MTPLYAHVYNILIWILWVWTLNVLLPRRLSLPVTLCLELAAYWPYYFLVTLVSAYPSGLKTAVGWGFAFLVFFLLHKGKWYTKTLCILAIYIVMVLSEMTVYFLMLPEQPPAQTDIPYGYMLYAYVMSLVFTAALLGMLMLLGASLRRRFPLPLNRPQMLLFLLFILTQHLLLIWQLRQVWQAGQDALGVGDVLLILFSALAADGCLFLLIRETAVRATLDETLRLKREEGAIRDRLYAALEKDARRTDAMERDLAEAFSAFAARIEEKRSKELIQDADRLLKERPEERFPACRNRIVAAFLANRQRELQEKGIPAQMEVALPAQAGLSDTELICALGNLLDNAEEACQGMDAPLFRLKGDYQPPYFRLRMENSLPAEEKPRARRVPELERGLGLGILRRLAERHDGEFRCESKDGVFCASLLLKGEADHAADSHM